MCQNGVERSEVRDDIESTLPPAGCVALLSKSSSGVRVKWPGAGILVRLPVGFEQPRLLSPSHGVCLLPVLPLRMPRC